MKEEVIGYIGEDGHFVITKGELDRLSSQGYTFEEIKEMYAKNGKKLIKVKQALLQEEKKNASCYEIEELDSSRQTSYHEGQQLSEEEVMGLFEEISGDAKNSNYRVGITNDPARREKEHDKTFLAVVGCPSVDKANGLEALAGQYGFDAGEHVGNASKGKKVYIFKK